MNAPLAPVAAPSARQRTVTPGRIAFTAAPTMLACQAQERLAERYGDCPLEQAEVIVPLGGDGFMLQTLHQVLETLHRVLGRPTPVYGMNCGSVGFLMNPFEEAGLIERISQAQEAVLHPLRMHSVTASGDAAEALAFNEVSLLRQLAQAAKIRITVDGRVRLAELICDGVLVSTPAGSSAYNLSAHGPIVPLSANLLPMTPISAFRPRRWRGALLPSTAAVLFEVLEADKRPVAAVADSTEVRDVVSVAVCEDRSVSVTRAVRPRPGPVGADHRRAVHGVADTAGSTSPALAGRGEAGVAGPSACDRPVRRDQLRPAGHHACRRLCGCDPVGGVLEQVRQQALGEAAQQSNHRDIGPGIYA